MKEIKLTKGYVALVDDEDFDTLSQYKWLAKLVKRKDGSIINVYAAREVQEFEVKMHRFILSVTNPKIEVDHEDHNGLNNQKQNLRKATKGQNAHNRNLRSDSTSGFKGVSWHKQHEKWHARIMVKGKAVWLGVFTDILEAARAYDAGAIKYFRKFARTNKSLGLIKEL